MVELKTKNGQPEVNLVVLDRLVQDYMVEEDLVDEEGTSMRAEGSAPVRCKKCFVFCQNRHVLCSSPPLCLPSV